MSKHWSPPRHTAQLRKSRIRRDPVRLANDPRIERKVEAISLERQLWGGVTGILAIAGALVALAIGISIATFSNYDPQAAAAEAARFAQCYNASGPNCVLDGNTVYVDRQKVRIAGLEVPKIQDARCPQERNSGIDAALRLAELLNGGKVTMGPPIRNPSGAEVRKIFVNGDDIAPAMLSAGLARPVGEDNVSWCASSD